MPVEQGEAARLFGPPKGLQLAENDADKAMSDAAADVAAPPASPPPAPQKYEPQPADLSANDLLEQLPAMEVEQMEAVPPQTGEQARVPAGPPAPAPAAPPTPVGAGDGPSAQTEYVERPEDTEIILELLLDDGVTVLDSGVVGYLIEEDETVLLPLRRFTELLGFPIVVDTSKGTAKGWFISEDKTFSLEAPYKFIEIAGQQIPLDQEGIVETHLDDIYVSQDLLTSWFPIELTLNYGELRLYMKTLVDLPFQERAKRRSRWETSMQNQPGVDYDPKEIIRLPYKFYSAPSVELSHGIDHARSGDGGSLTGTSHALNAEGELFGMDARTSLSYQTSTVDRESVDNVQFNLQKEDFEGKLLGPLKATRYELGDISTGIFPLAGQQQGRGAAVTNEPYNFVRDPNNFRIEGFGPVGWDVEVFQDLELIAFAEIGPDGKYDFETLPLGEGFNIFKIILYGPNGEREQRYERFFLGQNMVEPGKFLYNVAALESSTPIFNFGAVQPDETAHTVSAIGEYGLNKSISTMAGYFHGPISDTALDGLGVGVRASGGRAYAQLNSFFDKSGGTSSSATLTGNLTDTVSFNMQHRNDIGYPDDYFTTLRTTTLQATKMFDFASEILPDFSLTLGAGREEEDTGRRANSYRMRLSTNFHGLSLSNELERRVFSDMAPDLHDGRLSTRYRAPFGILRGDLNYTFHNPFELKNAIASLQSDITDSFSITNGVDHSFGDDPVTSFNTSLDWKLDRVRLGLRGAIDSTHNKQIGMNMTYSLVPRTQFGDYAFAGRSDDVNSGSLLIRPFVDRNGNGAFDAGEDIVPGIEFKNMLRGMLSAPTQDGLVLLPGLAPSLANRIGIEEKSISDIYLTPVKKEILVLGRRGVNGPIDFAFSKLGEISGTVTGTDADGAPVALDAVHIVLLGPDGKEAADTYSEFDGYYSFAAIPVGDYEMFFPASETLAPYYAGSGEGPKVSIDFDNPEKSDFNIRFEQDRIILENHPESGAESELHNGVLNGVINKETKLDGKLRFFALKLNEIKPLK